MKKLFFSLVAAFTLASAAMAQQHVGQISAGSWKSEWIPGGNVAAWSPRNLWVDIWVHNLGFHKQVGILWTDNNWYTHNWSMASYEFSFKDGAECWGLDIAPIGEFQWHRGGAHAWVELTGYEQPIANNGKFIEYVIFYLDKSTGRMHWDNNGGTNYRVWVVQPGPNGYTL